MKIKRSTNSNFKFLYGSVFFFAMLVGVILLFVYYSVNEAMERGGWTSPIYRVSFSKDMVGVDCQVFLDDSLLYRGCPANDGDCVTARQYAVGAGNDTTQLFNEKSLLKVVVAAADTLVMPVGGEYLFRVGYNEGVLTLEPEKR